MLAITNSKEKTTVEYERELNSYFWEYRAMQDKFTKQQRYELYGLYMYTTRGPCKANQLQDYDTDAQARLDAWKNVEKLLPREPFSHPREYTKEKFIEKIKAKRLVLEHEKIVRCNQGPNFFLPSDFCQQS